MQVRANQQTEINNATNTIVKAFFFYRTSLNVSNRELQIHNLINIFSVL